MNTVIEFGFAMSRLAILFITPLVVMYAIAAIVG